MTRKIVYVMDSLVAGGVERQTTSLIAGLDRAAFRPRVLSFYGERAGASLHFAPQLAACGIAHDNLNLAHNPRSKLRAYGEIVRKAWAIQPDIIHTVNYHGNSLIGYARPLLPQRTRLVVSVRAENTSKQMRNQRRSWRVCDAIICNSPHLVEELATQANVPREKITHIPNGLDLASFQLAGDPVLRCTLAPDAERVFLMVTRISARKVPHMLPEALGLLKQRGQLPSGVVGWIVGEREDGETQRQIDAAIRQHDLQNVIRQYPQTADIAVYYHAVDVTVLVSLWGEGLPNVVIESLAAGRPVVISEAANRSGVIEDGVTGWVVRTGDIEHLAEVLRIVINLSQQTLDLMTTACREASQNYAMSKMIERHQEVYRRVLGEEGKP